MQPLLQQNDDREFAFADRDFNFLAKLVTKRTGIILRENKKNMVYSRLARRLRSLGLNSFEQYCRLIDSDQGDDEIGNLVNAITTNLTSFFREEHHFEHLRNIVMAPMLEKPPPGKRLRIWSAGCSAGMEAYSIAMIIHSTLNNRNGWDAKILATDIDTNMLNHGRKGQYSSDQLPKIPRAYHSYLNPPLGGDHITIRDELRRMVSFKPLNLLEAWPMSGQFDAVFCRNVVIYFDKPTQVKLFDRIADLIKDDGWLYIGHSENLHKVSDRFESIGHTIYRKIK